jgi:hypothetical protein
VIVKRLLPAGYLLLRSLPTLPIVLWHFGGALIENNRKRRIYQGIGTEGIMAVAQSIERQPTEYSSQGLLVNSFGIAQKH